MSDDTHDALPVLPLDEQAYEYIYAELYQFQRLIRTYREIANAISMKWPRATREVRLESSGKRPECPVVPTVIKGIPIRQSGQALGFPVSKVHPLLPGHLRALINTYCDPSVTDCMLNDPNLGNAKLFLRMGEESPRNEHLNTRLTRAVYFDQIVDAACCDLEKRVKQMGVALAIIHKKGYDAAGVEFQIAFHPKTRKVSMGVGSFTRCEKPCSLSPNLEYELALAIAHNPTWPRPPGGFGFIGYDSPLTPLARVVWETFRGAYMNAFFELGNTVGQTTFAPAVVMEHVCAMSNPDYAWITGQPEAYCA